MRNLNENVMLVLFSVAFISAGFSVEAEPVRDTGGISVIPEKNNYENNQLATDMNYKGNVVMINGMVESIKYDSDGAAYVRFKDSASPFNYPEAHFLGTETEKLLTINKGEHITAQCIGGGGGPVGDLVLKSCVLTTSALTL